MYSVDRDETAGEGISSQAIVEQPEITNIDSAATVVTPSKANDTSAVALDGLRSYVERNCPDLSSRVSEFRCEVRRRPRTTGTRSDNFFFHNSHKGCFRSYRTVLRFLKNLEKEGSSCRAIAQRPCVVDYDEETGEPMWEVERIEDARLADTWEVKVKWMGYSEMTWEPLCNLTSHELIEEARQMIEKKKMNKVAGCLMNQDDEADTLSQPIPEQQPEIVKINSTATVVTPSKSNDTSAVALDGLRSYLERCCPDLSSRVSEFRCEARSRTRSTRLTTGLGTGTYFFHNSQEGCFRSYVSVLRFLQNLEKKRSSSLAVAEQPNVVDHDITASEDISCQAIAEQPETMNIDSPVTVGTASEQLNVVGYHESPCEDMCSQVVAEQPELMNTDSPATKVTASEQPNVVGHHETTCEDMCSQVVAEQPGLMNTDSPATKVTASEKPNVVDHDEETGEPIFEVERIADARPVDTWEVKVNWMGYNKMIWEPLRNVTSDKLIEEARRMIEKKKLTKVGCKDGASRVVAEQPDFVDRDETAEPSCEVERIKDVRPVDTWEVKVKWVGYTRMTWEPLHHLRNNELVEEARRKIEEKKVGMLSRKGGKRSPPRTGSHADPQRGAKRQKQGHIILPALAFGGLPIDDIVLGSQTKPKKQSLLSHLFGGGHRIVTFTTNLVSSSLHLEGIATLNGAKLVLVATKVIHSKGFHKFGTQKKLRFFYVAAENGVEDVQQKLEGKYGQSGGVAKAIIIWLCVVN
jgi:hypothetical protein